MKDIVIVPTFFRPEYLALCLEHIEAARGSRDLDIRVYHDARRINYVNAVDTAAVCARFNAHLTVRKPHLAIGNTLNFLEAYKEAQRDQARAARYIYLIEDDVLPGRDFFDWHEAVQARGDYFCSVGWHCIRNPKVKKNGDPLAYIETAVDFSSIGVCWKREKLDAITMHAREQYYYDPNSYLANTFPGSPIPHNRWVEQAGLVMRVLLEGKGRHVVAWAAAPRCAHIGVSGYHRNNGPKFSEASLRAAVVSGALAKMAKDSFDDINTEVNTEPWEASKLYVSQRF